MRKYAFASIVAAVVVATTLVFTLSSEATGNLIGHWTFDDGLAADSSGNGNNGVVNGAVLAAGKVGAGSLNFDGTDDHVDLGTLDPSGSAITLAAWVNSDDLANCGASDCRIASKADGTGEQDHYIMLSGITSGGGVKLRFRLKAGGTTTTLIATSGNLVTGKWTHVAATYDGAFMRVYVDGVEVGSVAKTGAIDTNAAVPFWIGGNPDSPTSRPWDGKIDDVRLYDGALSQGEIQTLAESVPPTSQPDIVSAQMGVFAKALAWQQQETIFVNPVTGQLGGQDSESATTVLSPNLPTQATSLVVESEFAPAIGSTWSLTLRVDGTDSGIACQLNSGQTRCESGELAAFVPPTSGIGLRFDINGGPEGVGEGDAGLGTGFQFSWILQTSDAPLPTGPNLIANSSFENGSFGTAGEDYSDPSNPQWNNVNGGDSNSVQNWTVINGVEYFNGRVEAFDEDGNLGFFRSISLNNSRQDGGMLSDQFATIPGESYRLTFRMSGRVDWDGAQPLPGDAINPKTLDVLVNGVLMGEAVYDVITNSTGFPQPMNYATFTFDFVANATAATVQFNSTTNLTSGTPGGTTYGPMLDLVDVRLLN